MTHRRKPGRRIRTTTLLLIFCAAAPIGCSSSPKQLFSKVWGPDRIPFREVVGLGDAAKMREARNKLSSDTKAPARTAQKEPEDRKSFVSRIRSFPGALVARFSGSRDEPDAGPSRPDAGTRAEIERSKALLAELKERQSESALKRRPAGQPPVTGRPANTPDRDDSVAQLLRERQQARPGTAMRRFANADDVNTPENPFAEFQNRDRRIEQASQSAENSGDEYALARSENPFLGTERRETAGTRPAPQQRDTANEFVADFDRSFGEVAGRENSYQDDDFDDDDFDEDEKWDDRDQQDDSEEMPHFGSLAESSGSNSQHIPDRDALRRAHNRQRVRLLLEHARSQMDQGRFDAAENVVRYADQLAAEENVDFEPGEETPGDLLQIIAGRSEGNTPQFEELPPAEPFDAAPEEQSLASEHPENRAGEQANPFAEVEEQTLAENVAGQSADAGEPLPTLPTAEELQSRPVSLTQIPSPPVREAPTEFESEQDLQRALVDLNDPYRGMIVDSDLVPSRIPVEGEVRRRYPVYVAVVPTEIPEIQATQTPPSPVEEHPVEEPSPAIIPRVRTEETPDWIAVPVDLIQEEGSRPTIKPNRGDSGDRKRKKVNANRGARIVPTDYETTQSAGRDWQPHRVERAVNYETAAAPVSQWRSAVEAASDTNRTADSDPARQISTFEPQKQFYQIGGTPSEKSKAATPPLAAISGHDKGSTEEADSNVASLRGRFLIVIGIGALFLLILGLSHRSTLQLLRHRLLSR